MTPALTRPQEGEWRFCDGFGKWAGQPARPPCRRVPLVSRTAKGSIHSRPHGPPITRKRDTASSVDLFWVSGMTGASQVSDGGTAFGRRGVTFCQPFHRRFRTQSARLLQRVLNAPFVKCFQQASEARGVACFYESCPVAKLSPSQGPEDTHHRLELTNPRTILNR